MTARDLAFVGCRLLALYWAVTAIYQIANFAFAWRALESAQYAQEGAQQANIFYIMPLILYVAVAIGLWLAAPWLGRHVAPKPGADRQTGSPTFTELQAIAFAAVGLLIFLGAVPELVSALHGYMRLEGFDNRFDAAFGEGVQVARLAIRLVLGLALILSARALSGLLIILRRAGTR